MFLKREIRKYVSILLVLFLIFQLIPGTYENVECLNSHASNSVYLSARGFAGKISTFFARDCRKYTFYFLSVDFYGILTDSAYLTVFAVGKPCYYMATTDYRKVIKNTIPHYFHGSKYKGDSLFI
jgi:hypothetical protein